MSIISECNLKLTNQLAEISSNFVENLYHYEFNTRDLLEFRGKGSEQSCSVWNGLFNTFKDVPSPLIYWFDILSDNDPQTIFDTIVKMKRELPNRKFPSTRTNKKLPTSKTLYVGSCSKILFRDRLLWHTGYYVGEGTQGLQLCHWANPLNLQLRVTAIPIPAIAKSFVSLYENEFARQMIPIVGKQ